MNYWVKNLVRLLEPLKKELNLLVELKQGKLEIIERSQLEKLNKDINRLQKDNDRMMMTFYSARACRTIMDEIREIIDCPVGYSITDAIKELKEKDK